MVRKGLICALLISLCLVPAGCGGRSDGEKKSEALALETRTSYIAMTSCAGQAAITADYGERVYEYVLSFAYGQEEGLVLTLTEPEALAG
ncbi:MAG: hypothetical protein GX585_00095, partial [Clostridiales bacterium]|nr:hypothetical protein [Clostridiales bacterium]